MNEYEEQANKFLSQTKTEFLVKFLRNGPYFSSNDESRDIYNVTLSRGDRRYTFTFGQSINASGQWIVDYDISNDYCRGQQLTDEEHRKARGKFMGQGKWSSRNKDFSEPTPYSVLASIESHDPDSFENFCSEFGYDTDSRTAESIYKAVKDQYLHICTLYNVTEMELLTEII